MKKTLSLVIAISMLLGMMIPMGITVSAAEATACATWAEVVAAVEADSAASIKLTADVTATSSISTFSGTFDGNGYTVTISGTLFDAVADGATIKNLTVASASELSAAPFIASASGTVAISDVTVDVDVNTTTGNMGAFVATTGAATTITLTNCVNNGALTSSGNNVAGFIGQSGNALTATFTNCVNNGNITTTKSGGHVGGFIACLQAAVEFDVTFNSCANYGSIAGNSTKNEVSGFITFTGEAASTVANFTFNNCLSAGALSSQSNQTDIKYSPSGFISRIKNAAATVTLNNCLSALPSLTTANSGAGYFWCKSEAATSSTLTATNSYYLPIEGIEPSTVDATFNATAVTADQLASGEVAYKLGEAWGQDLATEDVPVIGGKTVLFDGTNYYNESAEPTAVETIGITGFAAPAIDGDIAASLAAIAPAGEGYTISDIYWKNGEFIATTGSFTAGNWNLCVDFTVEAGYTFADGAAFTIDGAADNVDHTYSIVREGNETAHLETNEFTLEGESAEPDGTEENPFVITDEADVDAIDVPAGTTQYFVIDPYTYTINYDELVAHFIRVVGADATINGASELELPNNGRTGWPVHFSITAGANENAGAELYMPAGTETNPDTFEDGQKDVSIPAYSDYFFTFTADKNGILVVTAPDGSIVTINNNTTYEIGDIGTNSADVCEGDEIQIVVAAADSDVKGTVSVEILPHLKVAVWTKNGEWVTAAELTAIKEGFLTYLESLYTDLDASTLGIEWVELVTDENKVADLGALVNEAGDFDIIIGCGNNVDAPDKGNVVIVDGYKGDVLESFMAAGRKAALLNEDCDYAIDLYNYLTTAPAEILDGAIVEGITAPELGDDIAANVATVTAPEGANYTVHAQWYCFELDEYLSEGTFEAGKSYWLCLAIIPADGYEFAEDATVTFEGAEDLLDNEVTGLDENGYLLAETVSFDFEAPVIPIESVEVNGIEAPLAGETLAEYLERVTFGVPESAKYAIDYIQWFELEENLEDTVKVMEEDDVFEDGKIYGLAVYFSAFDGYGFADDAEFSANDGELDIFEASAMDDAAGVAFVFDLGSPETGDSSAIVIFAVAAVATFGCVALTLRKKKED